MSTQPITATFADRHIGIDTVARAEMLAALGLADVDELVDSAVPSNIRTGNNAGTDATLTDDGPMAGWRWPAASESEALARLRDLGAKNRVVTSMIGLGYHDTITPPVITRNLLENPAWYTAYTPYQPEISQGRLEALLNYQTLIADLTGRELANASLLDEATAAAEAMALLSRMNPNAGTTFVIDADALPQTIEVVRTRAEPLGIDIVIGDPAADLPMETFGVLFQNPGASGAIRDLTDAIERVHARGALAAVSADILSLCLVTPPGEMGADVVVGSAQRFGVPMGYGGPHAGFMAVREEYKRSLPGRLVGVSRDSHGQPALRLALQTREQHIRREKATSNICTAQVLLAVVAGAYAVYHGPGGLRAIAERVHNHASALARALRAAGIEVENPQWFDTITLTGVDAPRVVQAALERGINIRMVDDSRVSVACDEATTEEGIASLVDAFGANPTATGSTATGATAAHDATSPLPGALVRTSAYCTHEVFSRYHSETDMMRYLRRLSDRDLALDRTMIPLGSCTMKLNAAAEMMPITWPEFARMHPFAPTDQAGGYRLLISELEEALCKITGYDAVSLQPNAGSQGELAGLLAIRAFHRANGEAGRNVCLIPASAHGTNAASAAMAGMRVEVVACDEHGNIDTRDLRARCDTHGADLAALMVTYPSTHGVFEAAITEICELVHSHGGQVYLDGANLNAMVGLAEPGRFGADVSHLNLHKTFCIPHGGGGPGIGPIGVRSHLAPFLPNHPVVECGPATGIGPISAAPWGSAGILPISWAYIQMMGADGLTEATKTAILSANYVARRLETSFPVLYTGESGFVAHECIVDLREITKTTGVTVDDVAKRLMDFGFHAPTMSFPVPGTLMIEPTESESKAELDRFCSAMIAIKGEIDAVADGFIAAEDSPLRHAPHTAACVTADEWDRAYPRSVAAYPAGDASHAVRDKYWPPVGRIDGAHGDKNLMCSCPPMDAYL